MTICLACIAFSHNGLGLGRLYPDSGSELFVAGGAAESPSEIDDERDGEAGRGGMRGARFGGGLLFWRFGTGGGP